MKIVYDIEMLGESVVRDLARTGIFRVVEKVAEGLASSEECELTFFASDYHREAEKYLQSSLKLKEVPLLPEYKEKNRLGQRLQHRIREKEKAITRILDSPGTSFGIPLKILRYGMYSTRKLVLEKFNKLGSIGIRPDLFHSPSLPVPRAVQEDKSIRKFLTVYDLIPILYPQYFPCQAGDHVVKRAIKSIEKDGWFLCISDSTKNDLCEFMNIPPERAFVTHLAASPEFFYPCADQPGIDLIKAKYKITSVHYFLSLSTLEPRKNIDRVIRCFAKTVIEQNIKDTILVLVGTKGWDSAAIFSELESFPEVKSRIIVTGYVPDEDLAPLYSGAIGFLYTSYYEGFGLPPLEAMQCGVPVITSNTSSLPEVVGEAGILVDPRDEDALCQAMLRVYGDAELRAEMSAKSLAQAARFSWEKCVRQTIEGYKTALKA